MSDVFVVPPSEGEKPENRFHFKASKRANAKVHSVPFMQYLSGEGAAYVDSLEEKPVSETRMVRNILSIECPDAADEIKKLSNDQIGHLFVQWNEKSNATVGESSASEGS